MLGKRGILAFAVAAFASAAHKYSGAAKHRIQLGPNPAIAPKKIALTKKQKRARAASKRARKARRINRKFGRKRPLYYLWKSKQNRDLFICKGKKTTHDGKIIIYGFGKLNLTLLQVGKSYEELKKVAWELRYGDNK